jgi:hypothetical protein
MKKNHQLLLVAAVWLAGAFTLIAQGTVTLPSGANWLYLDNGSDQGTTWQGVGFNDSAWPNGPAALGFGIGGEQTVLQPGPQTYYFRHSFTATNVVATSNLLVRLQRDDGAVVYLNEVEIFRSNMPTGEVHYLTLASAATVGADQTNFFASPVLTSSVLKEGTNVLAVEVHQASVNDGDLAFDLELTGNVPQVTSVTGQAAQGWSTIANNFDHGNNTLNELFPLAADGTEIYKWNPATLTYSNALFDANLGGWFDASYNPVNFSLNPGEGAWIHSPAAQSLSFSGQVKEVYSVNRPIGGGRFFVGCRQPMSSTFADVMGFPPAEGDQVFLYEGNFATMPTQATRVFTFRNGDWSPVCPPLVSPGQGVFVNLVPSAPEIVQEPQSQTVTVGDPVTLSVLANGVRPLAYQWYHEGQLIAGATSPTYNLGQASPTNSGTYFCGVTNTFDHIDSSNAVLTVNAVPMLSIALTPTNTVAISWPSPATGFVLQENTNSVSSSNWNEHPFPQDNGTIKFILANPTTGNRFYRLKK